eukprot:TRINITY_DN4234_c0_g1_i1.p1 TRINITY_DN4234_c0_g1~~TRINITY_DN4234_c0_g1_i1.p1  ORF type:complete len:733 (-),score=108.29 TRINITY_DN4234_c0_g1_i1:29-2197(-)
MMDPGLSEKRGRRACTEFLEGTCNKGRDCPFAHIAEGDWACPRCGDHNFARKTSCRKCNTPKDGGSRASPMTSGRHGRGGQSLAPPPTAPAVVAQEINKVPCREFLKGQCNKGRDCKFSHIADGDWACPRCSDHNFGRNETCRKCGTGKPRARSEASRGAEMVSEVNGRSACKRFLKGTCEKGKDCIFAHVAEGDWLCPECGDHNFARNQTCRRCGGSQASIRNEAVGSANVMSEVNGRSACRLFLQGTCTKGKDCRFAHVAEGDWACPQCGDHNFAKNASCRKCNASKRDVRGRMSQNFLPPSGTDPALAKQGVKKVACALFLKGQCNRGKECAFSHIADGDWFCPSCEDHNFAKNETCRKCNTAKPSTPSNVVGNASTVSEVKGRSACRRFLAGTCNKGKDCLFAHIAGGDWICPECGDHNFARNDTCRKCGSSKPSVPIEPVIRREASGSSAGAIGELKGREACKRFLQGTCSKGKDCLFAHIAEGDWACPECGDHNFARNDTCRKCGDPKPSFVTASVERTNALSEVKGKSACRMFLQGICSKGKDCRFAHIADGDWVCPDCGDHNFARNETCRKCGTDKHSTVDAAVADAGRTSEAKDRSVGKWLGDWVCPECGDQNFARNDTCRRCGVPKPNFADEAFDDMDDTAVLAEVKGKRACKRFLDGTCHKGKDCAFAHVAEGDWTCPDCEDHNFAKNATCRKCGTPKTGTAREIVKRRKI